MYQSILKNHIVVPNSGQIRPRPPANVPGLDAQGHFVAEAQFLELVQVIRLLVAFSHMKVSLIYQQQTIDSDVSHLPVFKYNLAKRVRGDKGAEL